MLLHLWIGTLGNVKYISTTFKEHNLLQKWTSIEVAFVTKTSSGCNIFETSCKDINDFEIELTIARMKEGANDV